MLDHFSGKDQYVGILVSEGVYQGASACSPTRFLRTEAFPQDLRAKPSDAGLGSSFAHSICRVIHSLVHIFARVSHSEWMLSWLRTEKGKMSTF